MTILIQKGPQLSCVVASTVVADAPVKWVTADGQVAPMTSTAEVCAGITGEAVSTAGVVTLCRVGDIVQATAGGTCTLGGPAMWATTAHVVDATGNVKTIGTFVSGTTTSGDKVSLHFCPGTIGTG